MGMYTCRLRCSNGVVYGVVYGVVHGVEHGVVTIEPFLKMRQRLIE